MLISHKNKFIILSIPKTGSRSLRETLEPLKILDIIGIGAHNKSFKHHGTSLECKHDLQNIGYCFDEYFSFCVVRNPWDRYLSLFKYCKEKKEEYLNKDRNEIWHKRRVVFGKFCVDLFEQKNDQEILKKLINTNLDQSCYYLNNKDEIMVSHIAKFENIQKEFDYFCETVGLDKIKLLHSNKSVTQISCRDIYDQELVDLVEKKEKKVINLMSYQY